MTGRTWRPRRTRVTAFAMAAMIMALMLWLAFMIADTFKLVDRIGIVLFGALVAAILAMVARSRVTADEHGLTVVNPLRTHRYAWAEVVGLSYEPGAPWPYLDLADGTSKGVVGIQGSEKAAAWSAIAEIRELIAQRGEAQEPH
ncbi:PH domain-containing protein [Actinocorallia populi]|uniref:PH domain-containing protein n=1 Tax=Actinocorallia populi TaxID=2079200 RepID=UPI000D08E091|nr:PH domain-containing protein [Actinocorallia populi]